MLLWAVRKRYAYYLAQQNNILPANDKYSSRNVSVFVANVDPFNGLVEHQIRKLVNASQVADKSSPVSQQYH